MFAKIDVNGDDQSPLYSMLKAQQAGDGDSADIGWNFEKFLVCLLYTSPSPRDGLLSRMPSSA